MTTRAVFSNVFDSTLKSYYHDRECEIIETIIDPASFNVPVPLVNLLPRFKLKFIDIDILPHLRALRLRRGIPITG